VGLDDMLESESIIRELHATSSCSDFVGLLQQYTRKKFGRSSDKSRGGDAIAGIQACRLESSPPHRLPRAFCPIKTTLAQPRTVRTGQRASVMIL
jgi:hypothetical protein